MNAGDVEVIISQSVRSIRLALDLAIGILQSFAKLRSGLTADKLRQKQGYCALTFELY